MRRWAASLRWRLLLAALLAVSLALVLAGVAIARLFERHVTQQFDLRLQDQLTQLLAALEPDADGQPVLARPLADPRWQRPYGGLYWQVQAVGRAEAEPALRSRSLWDERLPLADDTLPDGALHRHALPGPAGQRLRALERAVQWGDHGPRWRVVVAADTRELEQALGAFHGALARSLAGLGAALLAAVAAQLWLGLRPLRALQHAVQRVRDGHETRLRGHFVAEVQPLVEDFNRVLAHDEQGVERARRLAGNLAHAIKTPLAVIGTLAEELQPREPALATALQEQVQRLREQVDWHLRRARAASAAHPARPTPVQPVLEGLLRVMRKVHAHAPQRPDEGAELAWDVEVTPPGLAFAGEAHDLQEIAGNLLDNAGKWARTRVEVRAWQEGPWWVLCVQDDGPGLTPEQCAAVLQRGVRADERAPGAGLGLDIVREVVSLYSGQLQLQRSPWGGLAVQVRLPAAA
ncbi:signal transduction histidine kinase [Tepidimonas ignava]|uniref:histidine kinase n=1 Tax=Tepidimonas ignava TaxID=114249 RepID=A0A4R3LDB8_9BURK|nr:sensor histidine kinase [Tepidimonas ignava]TCS97919.1 signal transduction histidine kinase [Tepidimonas ignava]TSE23781.1 Virulence sensor histidine kinase PhoQ [Tepidimonas ignava]